MSYIEYLRKQRASFAAGWISFIHAYRPSTRECYAFFEGYEDVAFFMPEIRRRSGAWPSVRSFVCKGKQNLLRLIPIVRRKLDHSWRGLFFVDKDVDDLLGVENLPASDPFVFRTTWYSVEDYLVSEEVVACVWTDLMQLPDEGEPKSNALKFFRRSHGEAMRKLNVLMAWIICHRKRDRRPNLNNLSLAKLFEVRSGGEVKARRNRIDELDRACGVCTPRPCLRSVLNMARRLRSKEAKSYIRGKFEMWMFVRILDRIAESARACGALWSGRDPASAIVVTPSNAVTVLVGRITAPIEVTTFLDRAAAAASAVAG